MKEFLFKLLRLEWEKPHCENCEKLMLLLESERRRNDTLLGHLLKKDEPTTISESVDLKAAQPSRYTPFSIIRQKLEEADRATAEANRIKREEAKESDKIIAEKRTIEDLEKELDITDEEPIKVSNA